MIGETIKTLRLQVKISQEELAKLMNINRVSLSQIEAGERKVTTDELILLSSIFEVDANVLLGTPSRIADKQISPKDKHYKMKQLILYISSQLNGNQNYGETVLNKLLYFADFDYFEWTGELITDEVYVKLPYGPVPKAMTKILEEMQKDGQIQIVPRTYFGKVQKNILPLIDYNLDFLQALHKENLIEKPNYTPYPDLPHPQELLRGVLAKYGSRNAEAISDWSHKDVPYLATEKIGEIISPGLAFYRKPEHIANPHNLEEDPDD